MDEESEAHRCQSETMLCKSAEVTVRLEEQWCSDDRRLSVTVKECRWPERRSVVLRQLSDRRAVLLPSACTAQPSALAVQQIRSTPANRHKPPPNDAWTPSHEARSGYYQAHQICLVGNWAG